MLTVQLQVFVSATTSICQWENLDSLRKQITSAFHVLPKYTIDCKIWYMFKGQIFKYRVEDQCAEGMY